MRRLMESDPAEFARQSIPQADRARLPTALQELVETRVQRRGSFAVSCLFPPGEHADEAGEHRPAALHCEVRLDGVLYRAFVFGKWKDQGTVREARIEGIVLGDALVLGDAPTPDEQAAAGEPVVADAPNVSGPNTVLYIIARFSDQTNDPISDATALSRMSVVNEFWLNNSSGTVSIRGLDNPSQVMDIVHVTLPQPTSYVSTYNANFAELLGDARAKAQLAGFDYANYNLDVTVTSDPGFGYAGRAYVNGQGAHLLANYTTLRTAGHELGHNLGLFHANYWRADSPAPFGRDSVPGGVVGDTAGAERIEYGHYFSLMSAQYGSEIDDPTKPHYAAAEKVRLGWLSGGEVNYVSASGAYRLYRLDHRATTGTPRGIRIETPASDYTGAARRYWLNYRFAPWATGYPWLQNGLQIDVCQASYSGDGAIQLDMTPYSYDEPSGASWTSDNCDKRDGALVVGRTYSDIPAGVHITPTGSGNTGVGEEYIDVVINLGAFAANRPPVIGGFASSTNRAGTGQSVSFAVNAVDPDGDPLVYWWDFDERQVWTASGLNTNTAVKSWSGAGQYRVQVTVSDMKGGVASESAIITVGTPANALQIWGRVLWGGQPVNAARVSCLVGSAVYQAWSESDGSYVLTDLPSTNAYTVKCQAAGLTFDALSVSLDSFASGIAFGQDFLANESLPGGSGGATYSLSGQVTYADYPVAGAEVRVGGVLARTDLAGYYQVTNLPIGTYAVTPSFENYNFSPASLTVTLSANSTGNDFARAAPYTLSGRIYGLPSDETPMVLLSNGRWVEATYRNGSSKSHYFMLTGLPAGSYSLVADLAGYSIIPTNFANPITLSGSYGNLNFTSAVTSVAGSLSGRITERGQPLPGAIIEARLSGALKGSAITDSDGWYLVPNLPEGAYTLTPSLAGYSFTPATATAREVPAEADFTATGPYTPPVISSAQASPSTVPDIGSVATLSATVTGSGPFTCSWAVLNGGGPVSFSANDSTAASSTVATFQAPGAYLFRIRVTDSHGLSSTSTVPATVLAGSGAMAVAPYEVQVANGESMAFHAQAWDAVGTPVAISPAWSVSGGGAIAANGVFTADTPGGPFQVTAVSGALAATATVWVTGNSGLPVVTLSALCGSLPEIGPGAAAFRLSRSSPTNQALTVQLRVNGAAVYPADYSIAGADSYEAAGAVVTLPAGAASQDLVLTPVNDSLVEGDETVALGLLPDASYLLGSPTNATLSLADDEAAVAVVTHPQSVLVTEGSNALFSVAATGSPAPLYQWFFNTTNAIIGATGSTLALTNVGEAQAGFYSARASNGPVAWSSSAQLVLNHRPVPVSPSLLRGGGVALKVRESALLGTDADGDTLTLSLSGASSLLGAAISRSEGWLLYQPPAGLTNADTFTYTVSDGRGGFATGVATVAVAPDPAPTASLTWTQADDGTNHIRGSGIPGRAYRIEFAESLETPLWQVLGTATADEFGLLEYFDRPPEAAPARHYRTQSP